MVDDSSGITVRKSRHDRCDAAAVEIALALASPCRIRLDRLLATELGVTRSQLQVLHDRGALRATRKALRSPIVDGQTVSIDLSDGLVSPDMAFAIRRGACGCSGTDSFYSVITGPPRSGETR
jgi:hypothetical protein